MKAMMGNFIALTTWFYILGCIRFGAKGDDGKTKWFANSTTMMNPTLTNKSVDAEKRSAVRWSNDLRCGPEKKEGGECDKDSAYYCCSKYGWCGHTAAHCDCKGCINYRDSANMLAVDKFADLGAGTSVSDDCTKKEYGRGSTTRALEHFFVESSGIVGRLDIDSKGIIRKDHQVNKVTHRDCQAQRQSDQSFVEFKMSFATEVEVTPWLKLVTLTVKIMYARWGDVKRELIYDGQGTANLYIGTTAKQYNIKYSVSAGDVDFKLHVTRDGSMTAGEFVNLLKDGAIKLLIPNDAPTVYKTYINMLTFTNKVSITVVPTGNPQSYVTYIDANNNNNINDKNLLSGTVERLSIYCNYDYIKESRCALLAKLNPFEPSNLIPSVLVHTRFAHTKPMWFFQSSLTGIADVSPIPWFDEFKNDILSVDDKYLIDNKERKENEDIAAEKVYGKPYKEDQGIIAKSCFRYRNTTRAEIHLIEMCPTDNSFKFFLGDEIKEDMDIHVQTFMSTNILNDEYPANAPYNQWMNTFKSEGQKFVLNFIEVNKSSVYFNFKARDKSTNSAFNLIPALGNMFTVNKSSIIVQVKPDSFAISVHGSGNEEFLGYDSSYTFLDNNILRITLQVPSNSLLMGSLMDVFPNTLQQVEIDVNPSTDNQRYVEYKTVFPCLKEITLDNLVLYHVYINNPTEIYKFNGIARLGIIEANFMVLLKVEAEAVKTYSCFYKQTTGRISEVIDAIHGKPFFDNSWIEYEKISVLFMAGNHEEFPDVCINTYLTDQRNNNGHSEDSHLIKVTGMRFATNCDVKVGSEVGRGAEAKFVELSETSHGCELMKKLFENHGPYTLYGTMKEDFLKLRNNPSSKLEFKFGDNIKGSADKLEIKKNAITKLDSVIKIEGTVIFEGASSIGCKIRISGDVVFIKFGIEDVAVKLYEFNQLNQFSVWFYPAGRRARADTSGNYFYMKAPIVLGTTEKKIKFGKRKRMELRLHKTQLTSKSQFYACKERTKQVKLQRILEILSFDKDMHHFLKRARVKEFCVISNPSEDDWEIENLDEKFVNGLSFRGIVISDVGLGGQKYSLPLYTINDDGFQLCVRMPVLQWGEKRAGESSNDPAIDSDEGEDVADRVITTKIGRTFVKNGFVCDFNYGYGPFEFESSESGRQTTIEGCVDECTGKRKNGTTGIDGIQITIEENSCTCIHKLKRLQRNSQYHTCFLRKSAPYPIEMSAEKGEGEIHGPEYCYKVPSTTDTTSSMYLKGFIKSFAFYIENAEITITEGTDGNKLDFKLKSNLNINLFDKLSIQDFDFTSTYEGGSIMNVNCKLSFKVSIAGDRHAAVITEQVKKLGQVANKYLSDITVDYNSYHSTLQERQELVWQKILNAQSWGAGGRGKRSRVMQGYSKDCAEECGYAQIPGWSVDSKCGKSSIGVEMSCPKYKRDAAVSSNVECIANCEADRVKSHSEVMARTYPYNGQQQQQQFPYYRQQQQHYFAPPFPSTHSGVRTQCVRKGYAVRQKLETVIAELKKNIDELVVMKGVTDELQVDDYNFAYKIQDLRTDPEGYEITLESLDGDSCMKYHWKFIGGYPYAQTEEVFWKETLCLNGFFDMLVSKTINKLLHGDDNSYHKIETQKIHFKSITEWNGLTEQSQKLIEQYDEFLQCVKEDVASGWVSAGFRSDDFSILRQSTVESFDRRSPWVVTEKKDVIGALSKSVTKYSMKNATNPITESPCMAAKRAAIDYNDIANYVNQWAHELQVAKRSMNDLKERTEKRKRGMNSLFKEKNYTSHELQLMKYWNEKTNSGLEEWAAVEEGKINKLNGESLPIIRKQLEYAYLDDQHHTLSDFFSQRNVDGMNAVKRANINTASPNTFSDISKILSDAILSGKSLEEISAPIENAVRQSEALHKRTIECTA